MAKSRRGLQPTEEPPAMDEADGVRVGESPPGVPGMTLRCICRGHQGTIGRIAWSPCGRFIASPSQDETVRIWDANDGECLAVLNVGAGSRAVAWSPDSKYIASLGSCGLNAWDAQRALAGRTPERIALSTTEYASSVAWSPDGKTIATGYEGQRAALWDANSYARRVVLGDQHSQDADVYVAWSPDGTRLLHGIAYLYTGTNVWDAKTSRIVKNVKGENCYDRAIHWSPTGFDFAVARSDKAVHLYDAASLNSTLSDSVNH